MYRLPKKNVETYEMRRKKIRRGIFRDKIVLLTSILLFIAGFVYEFRDYFACLKKTEYFPVEELESYEPPVVFLSSDSGRYFIILDDPDKKYFLDYTALWDSKSSSRTFLFGMEEAGKYGIYEYDMIKDKYRCLIDEDSVCAYLNLPQDSRFASAYYYFDDGTISFVYADYLIIYNTCEEEFVYSTELISEPYEAVYGWLTPQTLLMRTGEMKNELGPIYEVNVYTGERAIISYNMGINLSLTDDKTMGSSRGDEETIGGDNSYHPVLVWDTQNYKIKKFPKYQSTSSTKLSADKKYVMFTAWNDEQTRKISCIQVKDGSLCDIYITEDIPLHIIWW